MYLLFDLDRKQLKVWIWINLYMNLGLVSTHPLSEV